MLFCTIADLWSINWRHGSGSPVLEYLNAILIINKKYTTSLCGCLEIGGPGVICPAGVGAGVDGPAGDLRELVELVLFRIREKKLMFVSFLIIIIHIIELTSLHLYSMDIKYHN